MFDIPQHSDAAPTPPPASDGVDLEVLQDLHDRLRLDSLFSPSADQAVSSAIAEIQRLRAALDDKVVATGDYEAVDLEEADVVVENTTTGWATFVAAMIAELRHHRAVANASAPRTVKLCNECGRGYVAGEGCLWCAKEELTKGLQLLLDASSRHLGDICLSDSLAYDPDYIRPEVAAAALVAKHAPAPADKEGE